MRSSGSPAVSLSAIADASNAIGRLYGVFEAELLEDTHVVDPHLETAIEVKGASFTWDAPAPEEEGHKKKKKHGLHGHKKAKAQKQASAPSSAHGHGSAEDDKAAEERIFKVTDVTMSIPRGALVAIVGPVGSGKTSLLQGIIGEMRQTSGTVTFGGSVGYCSQSAWIQVSHSSSFCRRRKTNDAIPECDHQREHMLRAALRRGKVLESGEGLVSRA